MASLKNPSVVPELLAELGLTDEDQLGALTQGTAPAVAHLAQAAAMALRHVSDAERQAALHLDRISELHGYEAVKLADGLRGDATWLVQVAARYADALDRLQAGIEQFRAAAYPLRLVADLHPGKATAQKN